MPNKLLEADFPTVDLRTIFAAPKAKKPESETQQPMQAQTQQQAQPVVDWSTELKKRLEVNKQLAAEVRESDYAIESKFFEDFFKAIWQDDALVKQLQSLGEPLKKVFKVLGFDDGINPLLKFLTLDFVKKELLLTKLINVVTFKAIYNAVALKLVTDSDFLKVNDYNIIYCRDLYKQPVEDMMSFLKLQKEVLYSGATTARDDNRKTFLKVDSNTDPNLASRAKFQAALSSSALPKVTDNTAKLNSLELANAVRGSLYKTATTAQSRQQIAASISTPPEVLAALQFLAMTTKSEKAKKALLDTRLASVSVADLIKATGQVVSRLPSAKLQTAEADELANLLLNNL